MPVLPDSRRLENDSTIKANSWREIQNTHEYCNIFTGQISILAYRSNSDARVAAILRCTDLRILKKRGHP